MSFAGLFWSGSNLKQGGRVLDENSLVSLGCAAGRWRSGQVVGRLTSSRSGRWGGGSAGGRFRQPVRSDGAASVQGAVLELTGLTEVLRDSLPGLLAFFFRLTQWELVGRKKLEKSNVLRGLGPDMMLENFWPQLEKNAVVADFNLFPAGFSLAGVGSGLAWFPSSQLLYPELSSSWQSSCD